MIKSATNRIAKPVLGCILLMLLGTGLSFSAEQDDSTLFVEAFNAFQRRDYLLSVEKLKLLQQVFPDSPLRDIALLLAARSGFQAGDNQLAATSVNQFVNEFSTSNLRATLEDELITLAARQNKGEKLTPNRQLRSAAEKVRAEQVAREQAAALKAEQERIAREKAEAARIAREKAEAEARERERLAAEKAAKESIRLSIVPPQDVVTVESGTTGTIDFELRNDGTGREEFLLSAQLPPEYDAVLIPAEKGESSLQQVALAPGETFKGMVRLKMPHSRVDGYKVAVPLRVVSKKYGDVKFSKEVPVRAAAPLVRAIVKPTLVQTGEGKTVTYRVVILNAGSRPARDLAVRTIIPQLVDFLEATDRSLRRESGQSYLLKVEQLESGKLVEFSLKGRVKDGGRTPQDLQCRVEIFNEKLQMKETFPSPAVAAGR